MPLDLKLQGGAERPQRNSRFLAHGRLFRPPWRGAQPGRWFVQVPTSSRVAVGTTRCLQLLFYSEPDGWPFAGERRGYFTHYTDSAMGQ
jgi:hypothetical protein